VHRFDRQANPAFVRVRSQRSQRFDYSLSGADKIPITLR
jgi:hypothetical protein